MPIFEYKCEACGTKFEKLVRRSDAPESIGCPDCGEHHLSQQYSTFAARANGGNARAESAPSCPSGMCGNPGFCGRN